jgi:hypothetical protein
MNRRAAFLAVLVLVLTAAPASAAAAPARPKPVAAPTPPIVFYVAKGAPDACGRGCDSWIAVEGQVDASAAPRFRKFLQRIANRNLPLYFHSPGGNLDRWRWARCFASGMRWRGWRAPWSGNAALRRRTARSASSSSNPAASCAAISGPAAPPATPPVPIWCWVRPRATERGIERADRMLSSYIAKMGGDVALLELARSIKFESMHVLTRHEIVRFGIDRREFVETPWTFENNGRSMARKAVIERNEADKSWRATQWRIICFNADQFELDVQRPAPTSAVFPALSISIGTSASQSFKSPPARLQGFEIWGLRMSREGIQSLISEPQFDFTETAQASGGKRLARTAKLSNEGLDRALASLVETCPSPRNIALRQTVGAGEAIAK